MAENLYSWNKTLKFSWGHIVAFVALIFMSFIAYMGAFYDSAGNFVDSAILVGVIDVALLVTFIGAQVMKGIDEKFGRYIVIERILIVLCIPAFILAFLPYNHFWTVYDKNDEISQKFSTAVTQARDMFTEFDEYSDQRIENYSSCLDTISNIDEMTKANLLHTLELQLKSENSTNLQNEAKTWLNQTASDLSVWDAFLIGNIPMVKEAFKSWNSELCKISEPILTYESAAMYDASSQRLNATLDSLGELTAIYQGKHGISVIAIVTAALLALMLLFPYLLQSRNTKAAGYYGLFKFNKKGNDNDPWLSATPTSTTNTQRQPQSSDDIYSGTF